MTILELVKSRTFLCSGVSRGSAGVLLYRGSNKVQMLAGVTAGARRGKLRISGKIKPGAMRFARLPEIFFLNGDSNAFAIGVVNRRPATCLTVDFGVAAEWRLSRRLVARADAGATIVSYHPRPRELNPWFTRHDVSFLIGPGLRF